MRAKAEAQFCRLPSGPRVAWATMGGGSPIVMLPGWFSHLEQSWSHPAAASARAKLARAHRFVWYDRLGCGRSDRDGFPITLENDVEQLTAVLDAAGIRRANLIGYSFGVPPAALFTARHPERVNRLVLYAGFARGRAIMSDEQLAVFTQMIRLDWPTTSRALATLLVPNASSRDVRWFSHFQQVATTPEMAARLLEHVRGMDVDEVLPEIRRPTLVAHNRRDRAVPVDAGREVAALVPGAELHLFEGNEHDPFIRDSGSVVETILDFVNGRPVTVRARPTSPEPGLTSREREVLTHLASGRTNHDIGAELGITVKTVERHVTTIYRKLDAGGRADATRSAVALGLVTPEPMP